MTDLYIGTSGWVYSHWEDIFYPHGLSSKEWLKYFSKHFKTVEVNYSFYHLPKPSTYQKWYSQTPGNFLFALKASRFITHIKRLRGAKRAWKTFLENALHLKEKLGPVLFQFPPSFQATEENLQRLEEFLKMFKVYSLKFKVRSAYEFRHKSWCEKKIYNLLKKHNVAWVIADSSRYPRVEKITTDFIYLRLHGPKAMFSSKYSEKQLSSLSKKIKKWLKQELAAYIYFNNDSAGYALDNAKALKNFL